MPKWMKRGVTPFLLDCVVKVTVMLCFISSRPPLPSLQEVVYLFRCYEYAFHHLEYRCFCVYPVIPPSSL
jgi:hypothetical protein